ncbi:iron-containing alcohol dehydrogenase, partial [bacterium]|nr:iron-containing alcohol dehydrogenase [bacterium]
MLPDYFEFTLPTRLIYGIGILDSIEDAVAQFKNKKALLVTGKIVTKAGLVAKIKKSFKKAGINITATFDDIPPNSTIKTVEDCAALGNQKKCDMIIALGGGSVIDTAKVANLLMTKKGNVQDHMGTYLLDPQELLLPTIVIPTTSGTGSEVTKVAVIADPDNDVKLPFAEDQFLPNLAILDPEMTATMPGRLTAYTGMDALVHAIEAYVDKEWSPASDALALHAIKLISENILQACANPEDLKARGSMQVGSFLAGVAFSHSMVGMVHGIAHALGGVYHIPHGLANTLILPEVMEYNLESCVERYSDVALAMGVSFPKIISNSQSVIKSGVLDLFTQAIHKTDIESLKDLVDSKAQQVRNFTVDKLDNLEFVDEWIQKKAALAGIEKIKTLNRQLAFLTKMPLNLKDAGIDDNLHKIEQLADTAMEDGSMLYNPVEPKRDAVIKIVKKVFYSQDKPMEVSKKDLHPSDKQQKKTKKISNVFSSDKMLYEILGDFYNVLTNDPKMGPSLNNSNLCIQFIYKNPDAVITIDATGKTIKVVQGDFKGKPQVTMSMNADFAHSFWHGKVNLVAALTR